MNLLKPAQAIIYTRDMEPITAIDMKPRYWDFLEQTGHINFAVSPPLDIKTFYSGSSITEISRLTVRIDAYPTRVGSSMGLILVTDTETEALLMNPTLLPGQQRAINEERKKAFAKGFLYALKMAMGDG